MLDLRFALRQLLKHRGLTAVIVLSLAAGIGANALVFTWIRATLLDAIPGAADSSRLTIIVPQHVSAGINDTMSLADIETLAAEKKVFAGITGSQFGAISVRLGNEPEWLWSQFTMANFFDVLGVRPALGRGFLPGEDGPGATEHVAVISHDLWQRRWHGDPNVLGKSFEHHRRQVTIVGVAPARFAGAMGGLQMDLWIPLATEFDTAELQPRYTSRSWRWLHTIARLAPGADLKQARATANAVGLRLARDFPDASKDTTLSVLRVWQSPWGGQALFLPLLRALALVAGLLLLLVSANVANLLLARAYARQRELGVRIALGASASRVIRQLLTESLLLAVLGGAGGLALAVLGANWLFDLFPVTYLPIGYNLKLHPGVLAATSAVTLTAGLLFGLAPALHAVRADLSVALKSGSQASSGLGPRQWLRRVFVTAEVGLALVLLIGMGLCIRSFQKARHLQLGLEPRGVWLAGFRQSPNSADAIAVRQFYQRLHAEAAKLPGITSAGLADWYPLGFEGGSHAGVQIPGYQPAPGESMASGISLISPGYFETLRIPWVEGRDFTNEDDAQAPRVAIINETFAKKYFAGRSPIGRSLRVRGNEVRVIGVSAAGKYRTLSEPAAAYIYLPAWQSDVRNLTLAVRTDGNPRALASSIVRLSQSLDSNSTPHAAMTYEDFVGAAFTIPRVAAILLSVLGILALILAGLGIYAVMAQNVSQRTREFGVRLALGARPQDVRRMIVHQGMRLTALGLLLGLLGAAAASRLLASLLVGVSLVDLITWVSVPLLLLAATLAASWLPARRAAHVDPMTSLRSE